MPTIRRLYLYLVALISLMAFMIGLIGVSGELIRLWFDGQSWQAAATDVTTSRLAQWGIVALISFLLWAVHWLLANRTARGLTMAAAAERNAAERKAYFYDGKFGALVALLLQIGLLLYDAILRALGGSAAFPVSLGGWPARPAALAAGAVIAGLVWLYLHAQARADGDVGHESSAGAGWRRTYQYLSAFLGMVLAAFGGAEFLRVLLALGGQVFYTLGGALPADNWRERVAAALAATLIGGPLALLAWRRADWLAADDATGSEVNSLGRKLVLYAGLLSGVAGSLASIGFLAYVVSLVALGQPVDDPRRFWSETLVPSLAYLPMALLFWWAFGRTLRNDMEWAPESPDTAAFRRLYFYLMAGLSVAAFWYGLEQVITVALSLLFGIQAPAALRAPEVRGAFSLAVGLLVAGGPVWWWHWQRAQHWARQPGPAGHEERTSWLRKLYLYGVVLAAAAVVVVTLGIVASRAPSWLLDPAGQASFAAALVQLGVSVALALVWWIGNGVVMRSDARLIAEQSALATSGGLAFAEAPDMAEPEEVTDAFVPVDGDQSAGYGMGHSAAFGYGPGRYDREQLPRFSGGGTRGAGARSAQPAVVTRGAAVAARQDGTPIAVIDGGNGAVGIMLLQALKEALPQILIWPIGLNDTAQEAMDHILGLEVLPEVPADALNRSAAILGPSDITMPGGLSGEVTPDLAAAVVDSPARKILLPPEDPRLRWVAAPQWSVERWVQVAVAEVTAIVNGA